MTDRRSDCIDARSSIALLIACLFDALAANRMHRFHDSKSEQGTGLSTSAYLSRRTNALFFACLSIDVESCRILDSEDHQLRKVPP